MLIALVISLKVRFR